MDRTLHKIPYCLCCLTDSNKRIIIMKQMSSLLIKVQNLCTVCIYEHNFDCPSLIHLDSMIYEQVFCICILDDIRWGERTITYVYAHQLNAWENSEIMWDECIIYFNMLWFSSYTNLCFIPKKRYGVYLFADGINSFLRKVQWTIYWGISSARSLDK